MSDPTRSFWRWAFGFTGILTLLAMFDLTRLLSHLGVALFRSFWAIVLIAMFLGFSTTLGLFWITWRPSWQKMASFFRFPFRNTFLVRSLGAGFFAVLMVAYVWLFVFSGYRWLFITDPNSAFFVAGWTGTEYILINTSSGLGTVGPAGGNWLNPWFHLWVYWLLAIAGSQALRLVVPKLNNVKSLAMAVLVQAVIYKLATFLPEISSYPFSLGWSEASRFYYGSLIFSERLYGMKIPLSSLHPTRYFLLSIPFAFGDLPILYHRLWQVFLWFFLTGTSSWLLVRRLRINDVWLAIIVGLWTFLFFLQGAVYYHLQVCVILILAGFSIRHPWRNFILVVLAAIWAGMSRVNWFPVPGMLAGALYWLEQPVTGRRPWWDVLAKPAIFFVVGILVALVSQSIYIPISGNTHLGGYTSSFTSDLLWNRLLPNPSNPTGVIPMTLLASGPLLIFLFITLRGRLAQWNFWRLFGLFSYTLVLLGGGLVVSTKIGGGGDLHNLDAYLVLLLIICTHIYFGLFIPDGQVIPAHPAPRSLIVFGLLVPISFVISPMFTLEKSNYDDAQYALGSLQNTINEKSQTGEVLFISHRHLLTYGELENVSLVPEYELLTLMEMAMSSDVTYLNQFHTDLRDQRFSLIVAYRQNTTTKEPGAAFGEENNAWVQYVSIPLLCEYESIYSNKQVNLQLFVPRATPPSPECYSLLPEP